MKTIQQIKINFEIERGVFKTENAIWWRDHIESCAKNLDASSPNEAINKIVLEGFVRSVEIAYDAILDVLCTKTYLEYTRTYILNQMLDFANEAFLRIGREDLCWLKVEV